MATASYVLKGIKIETDDGVIPSRVMWNAAFTDSDGVPHWGEVWYALTPTSEHSPEAAALLASATTSDAIVTAVRVDAERCLADLEDPDHPAGSRLFVKPEHTLPVAMTFDASGEVATVITISDEAAARVATALANAQPTQE